MEMQSTGALRNNKVASCHTVPEVLAVCREHRWDLDVVNGITALHRVAKAVGRRGRLSVEEEREVSELMQGVLGRLQTLPRTKSQDYSNLLWALATLRDIGETVLRTRDKPIAGILPEPRTAACEATLQALGPKGPRPWSPQALANSAWAIARFLGAGEASGGNAIKSSRSVVPRDLGHTVLDAIAAETALVGAGPLFVEKFSPQNIANIVWAFSSVEHKKGLGVEAEGGASSSSSRGGVGMVLDVRLSLGEKLQNLRPSVFFRI